MWPVGQSGQSSAQEGTKDDVAVAAVKIATPMKGDRGNNVTTELIKTHMNPFLMQKEILLMAILGLIKYIIQITPGG